MARPSTKEAQKLRLVRRVASEPTFFFSAAQLRVIAHRNSPLVVYGGPGTGKTRTLIESVIARVREGVDPNSILILTYGRESASDLRDAIALGSGSTSFEPLARTFHSLAFSILNEKLAEESARFVLISGGEQDAFIAEMLSSPYSNITWHPDLAAAVKTRGFVREVRDLILRSTELNLTPELLRQRGEALTERYWEGAAAFWRSYIGANELRSGSVGEQIVRIDPSAIISETLNVLEHDEQRLNYFRNRFSTIVVDEFQESDELQRKLLQLLAPKDLLIFADPDSAIGRFRGADPDSLVTALTEVTSEHILLTEDFRSAPEISSVISEVASRFHTRSAGRSRTTNKSEGSSTAISLAKLSSQSESASFIAHQLRSAHLRDSIPWSEMAVIVRTPGAEVAALQRACAQAGIPISTGSADSALAENPAIKPLLLLASLVLKNSSISTSDWPILEEVLFSEFGGTDALQLRQIRLAFAAIRSDHRSTTEMMIDALTDATPPLPWEQIAPLKRISDLLKAGGKAIRKSRDISDLLWALWNSAVNYEGRLISVEWRQRALAGGVRGAQADRDLDAVIQLFEEARRFSERNVGATPDLFIKQLTNERILSDSIRTSGQREDVVTVATVHSTKGQEWEFVVVTGLQEGVWPNLKERGSLLGSERLVESERSGLTIRAEISAAAATGLLEDERRLLYVAISRVKKRLLVVARSEEDSEPSRYFEELFESVHHTSSDSFSTELPREISTQALVSTLRRSTDEGSNFAASLLKSLSKGGIQSANPTSWLGVRELSTTEPIATPDDEVFVSPSSLESFGECGLKWFLERAGAKDGDSTAQLLGVSIHFIASQLLEKPDLTFEEGLAQLVEAWPIVDQNVGWYKDQQLEEASRMLKRFFDWHQSNPRELVLAEADMQAQFGRTILRGSVDRLERDRTSGHYFVVDIKTGSAVTLQEASEHQQLAAYQLGLVSGGFQGIEEGAISDGAGLLYLSKVTKKNVTLDQPPINPEEIIENLLNTAAGMSASTFNAIINKRCRMCAVKSLCPLQIEGKSVIE